MGTRNKKKVSFNLHWNRFLDVLLWRRKKKGIRKQYGSFALFFLPQKKERDCSFGSNKKRTPPHEKKGSHFSGESPLLPFSPLLFPSTQLYLHFAFSRKKRKSKKKEKRKNRKDKNLALSPFPTAAVFLAKSLLFVQTNKYGNTKAEFCFLF